MNLTFFVNIFICKKIQNGVFLNFLYFKNEKYLEDLCKYMERIQSFGFFKFGSHIHMSYLKPDGSSSEALGYGLANGFDSGQQRG